MKKKTVHARELSILKMVTGNERGYAAVVHEGLLKQWVGTGWVELRKATAGDRKNYPVVVG